MQVQAVRQNVFLAEGPVTLQNFDRFISLFNEKMAIPRDFDNKINYLEDFVNAIHPMVEDDDKLIDAFNVYFQNHSSTLFSAATHGTPAQFSKLQQKTANIFLQCQKTGNTLLHYAISAGSIPKTKLLIDAGAPLDVTNLKGETPDHFLRFKRAPFDGNILSEVLPMELISEIFSKMDIKDLVPTLTVSKNWHFLVFSEFLRKM